MKKILHLLIVYKMMQRTKIPKHIMPLPNSCFYINFYVETTWKMLLILTDQLLKVYFGYIGNEKY